MFNPDAARARKAAASSKVNAIKQIREWAMPLIPEPARNGLVMDINEVACGDPTCAPIDVVFTMVWPNGGRGMFALPMSAAEVLEEDIQDLFPVSYILHSKPTVCENTWVSAISVACNNTCCITFSIPYHE